MNEDQARTLLQKKLQGMTDAEAPLVWLGSLVENAPEAFIFEGVFMPLEKSLKTLPDFVL